MKGKLVPSVYKKLFKRIRHKNNSMRMAINNSIECIQEGMTLNDTESIKKGYNILCKCLSENYPEDLGEVKTINNPEFDN